MSVQQLLVEAEAAERLAALVSYEPDKLKLRQQAARLRQEAVRLSGEAAGQHASVTSTRH